MARSFLLTVYAPENIGFPHLTEYFYHFRLQTRLYLEPRSTHSTIISKRTEELNPLNYGQTGRNPVREVWSAADG